jgi:uncharacterized protein (TIGR00725 family)
MVTMESKVDRRHVVGVIGSGKTDVPSLTEPLGRRLALEGFHLLTGGGAGVMAGVSRAFAEHPHPRGVVIGIVPGSIAKGIPIYEPKTGYPNDWVELVIYTHLPLSGVQGQDLLSRNHINVLSSDVVIVLPGGAGTASEVKLAERYRKPVFNFDKPEQLDALIQTIRSSLGSPSNSTTESFPGPWNVITSGPLKICS